MDKVSRFPVVANLILLLILPLDALGQSNRSDEPITTLPEVIRDFPKNLFKTSGPSSFGTDVMVSNLAGDEAEVSIDINPTNPLNMVISGHAPGFRTLNTFFTLDGGETWTLVELGNVHDGITSTFRFDPSVAFDDDGRVYVAYGVRTFDPSGDRQETLVVCRSTDGGRTYPQCARVSTAVSVQTPRRLLPGNDKWHLATGPDPSNPNQQNVYIAWTQNVQEIMGIDQRIVVSGSTDGGATFSQPVVIADDAIAGVDRALFADPAVGPGGELYVAWHDYGEDQILMDVSLDGGVMWGRDKLIRRLSIPGLFVSIPAQPDRGAAPGPTIDTDRSGGPNHGRLYVTYMEVGRGGLPNTDIFVRSSDNRGTRWSAEARVNDDRGTASQFLPWLDVDQKTGRVSVVWYDTRNDGSNRKVELFHAQSTNGGASFYRNTKVSDGQSDQSAGNPSRWSNNFLEYIGVTSFDRFAYAVWADNSTSRWDLDYFFDAIPLDNLAPMIRCPADVTVETTEPGGTTAANSIISALLNGATAVDDFDTEVAISHDAGFFFPLGVTVVTFTATDDVGNSSRCRTKVIVVESTAPAGLEDGEMPDPEIPRGAPRATTLEPIYPNPFNPATMIEFYLEESGWVTLRIYDARGALVRTLANEVRARGEHRVRWSGNDDRGRPVATGVYFVRFSAGGHEVTRKAVMIK